jgi:hypothetical protein
VVGAFDGGAITSDAGALLLGQVDQAIGLVQRLSACFSDERDPNLIEHTVPTLVTQRVFGIALGYEDLNDHDQLRFDPVLAVVAGKLEAERKDCAPLAGKSTLNRLEHAPVGEPDRYHKIGHDGDAIEALFVDLFLEAHESPPEEIVLDLDATDDPLHGHQEGRFFHGYYDSYCYLPLYVFCGRHLVAAKLRQANIDASAGSVAEIERWVTRMASGAPRAAGRPRVLSEALMAGCEANRVDYVFGLAKNARLLALIARERQLAHERYEATQQAARVFKDFTYRTRDSWSRERRVVGKAEPLAGGPNPRFIVTSFPSEDWAARTLYEDFYCARGERENRIQECQLDLFADRTSAATMRANQLRLWFASFAYVLLDSLRRLALQGTDLARATCGSLRLKRLKLGALVKLSVRRLKIAFASACPYQPEWALAYARLAPLTG